MRWGGRPPLIGAGSRSCAEQGRGAVQFGLAGDAPRVTGLVSDPMTLPRTQPLDRARLRGQLALAGDFVRRPRRRSSGAELRCPHRGVQVG